MVIILILSFLNNIFLFSYNYRIDSKLNHIHTIEGIKYKYWDNYIIDTMVLEEINILETEIINKEYLFSTKIWLPVVNNWLNSLLNIKGNINNSNGSIDTKLNLFFIFI